MQVRESRLLSRLQDAKDQTELMEFRVLELEEEQEKVSAFFNRSYQDKKKLHCIFDFTENRAGFEISIFSRFCDDKCLLTHLPQGEIKISHIFFSPAQICSVSSAPTGPAYLSSARFRQLVLHHG